MRLKKIPRAGAYIAAYPQFASVGGELLKGKWQSLFETAQPLHIEIGMGKGGFINEMARRHPTVNFIGIELYDSVLMRSLEKLVTHPVSNLKLLHADARHLAQIFDQKEVSKIYLNFSDPWPKTRHEKRRLTHENFLAVYRAILVEGGRLQLKTDNAALFEYSLGCFNQFGMTFTDISVDVHANEARYPNPVMTEYERKFHEKGHPIYLLEASF
ncbi:MAG: tRNA (guanosine(46)-N7)-methyltransferase TrmB [Defluviitaleaceae bacterium]|nr:tRNA (guanosine(46)-N7)-methyltransferase TrmB [Defluviitaleaceae bacterium]